MRAYLNGLVGEFLEIIFLNYPVPSVLIYVCVIVIDGDLEIPDDDNWGI
jgi:hypothetical protein